MMGSITEAIRAAAERAGFNVHVVRTPDDGEVRTLCITGRGGTAAEVEVSALAQAREFFGDGPELHVVDGWTAHPAYRDSDNDGPRYSAGINVHAHGPLTKPEAAPAENEPSGDEIRDLEEKTHQEAGERHEARFSHETDLSRKAELPTPASAGPDAPWAQGD